MIPVEEHDILSRTNIADELTDVRSGVHRSDNQSDLAIRVLVFHLVDNCEDLGLRGEDILAIRTNPEARCTTIDFEGFESTVIMQHPVIRAGPSDPVLELNAEAILFAPLLDCHLSIINDLVQNEFVIRVEHFIVIDPPAEITSECLGLATETSSRKASPNCAVEQHANLKIVDFPMSVNEHSNLPPESWLRSMYIMVNGQVLYLALFIYHYFVIKSRVFLFQIPIEELYCPLHRSMIIRVSYIMIAIGIIVIF